MDKAPHGPGVVQIRELASVDRLASSLFAVAVEWLYSVCRTGYNPLVVEYP